jgi:hypothetical protein
MERQTFQSCYARPPQNEQKDGTLPAFESHFESRAAV